MGLIPVLCPQCHSDQGIKGGKTQAGQQRDKGQTVPCCRSACQLDLTYHGLAPQVKEHIVDMALHGSGIRDMARGLKVSPPPVMNALKKKRQPSAACPRVSWLC